MAFKLSGDIGVLLKAYNAKRNSIIADKKLSSSDKEDEEVAIVNDASEDFKQRYAYSYVLIQAEIGKRTVDVLNMRPVVRHEFGQGMVTLEIMAACAADIKELAKRLP